MILKVQNRLAAMDHFRYLCIVLNLPISTLDLIMFDSSGWQLRLDLLVEMFKRFCYMSKLWDF